MRTTVISEIGVNHQNDLEIARELISFARMAGADVAKFQCSTVMEEISFKAAPDHFREIGALVPTTQFLRECVKICEAEGIEFMCTPAGLQSLEIVMDLGVKRMKVSSDNLTNIPFLRAVNDCGLPVILSTGMSDLEEVSRARAGLAKVDDLTLLHCVSSYPAPMEEMNLNALFQLRLFAPVGLSDHTESTFIPAFAVAMGATVIEKHITLDRGMVGPDHAASLEPLAFQEMVDRIRTTEVWVGDLWGKRCQPSELKGRLLYRKSLVATRAIKKGEPLTPDNVTCKRPGTGITADRWYAMMGTEASQDFEEDDLIR